MAFCDRCIFQGFVEATLIRTIRMFAEETLALPIMHCGRRDAQLAGHFIGCQVSLRPKTAEVALKTISTASPGYFLQGERLILPSPMSITVENLGYLSITMMV